MTQDNEANQAYVKSTAISSIEENSNTQKIQNKPSSSSMVEHACFHEDMRYSGTDLTNSIIRRIKARNASMCQEACLKKDSCNFFLYFTDEHKMWFKRKECRLLRFKGELQNNKPGHISGPKVCIRDETLSGAKISQDLDTKVHRKNPEKDSEEKPVIKVATENMAPKLEIFDVISEAESVSRPNPATQPNLETESDSVSNIQASSDTPSEPEEEPEGGSFVKLGSKSETLELLSQDESESEPEPELKLGLSVAKTNTNKGESDMITGIQDGTLEVSEIDSTFLKY